MVQCGRTVVCHVVTDNILTIVWSTTYVLQVITSHSNMKSAAAKIIVVTWISEKHHVIRNRIKPLLTIHSMRVSKEGVG
ncbi:hypothetical protein ANAPC1_00421 [Anaplasma phagocytophilum]|uniref:Uncharacterized protein n=1 Tax=Anaplasma phagocytophilum TaxID=948 RepID=A0AA45USG2_ANAPH|nr:hypothetical protein [Anaplasma phagocytophilum]SBO14077.1 hypothetical protein ANAPC1_00421 [Anaplasma phagocytophilum]